VRTRRGGIEHPLPDRLVAAVDTWRVATRLLGRRGRFSEKARPHRFHHRKIKWLYLYVTGTCQANRSHRQRQVKANFRTLIERVEWIVASPGISA